MWFRPHRKVVLGVWPWFACQIVLGEIGGFGFRPVLTRPQLDVYLGPLTLAFGRHPAMTNPEDRERWSCRGFLFPERPLL